MGFHRSIFLICDEDGCAQAFGEDVVTRTGEFEIRRKAKEQGWEYRDGEYFCPGCKGQTEIHIGTHTDEAQQPHKQIDPSSREMDLLKALSREWRALEDIRGMVEYDFVDTYIHNIREMGFIDRKTTPGEQAKYRISALGMGVREYYWQQREWKKYVSLPANASSDES